MENQDEILTLKETAAILKSSKTKAYQMALSGELPSHRLGEMAIGKKPQYRFIRSEILNYIRNQGVFSHSTNTRPMVKSLREKVGGRMPVSNALPKEESSEKPSNLIRLKTTPKTSKSPKLPKGLYWVNKTIWINCQVNGRRKRISADTDNLTIAKAKLTELQNALATGVPFFENSKPSELLFRDFAKEAMKARAGKHGYTLEDAELFLRGEKVELEALKKELDSSKTPRFNYSATLNYFSRFKKILKHFGEMPVSEIKPATITAYLDTLKGSASNTKKNELAVISGIFNLALESGSFDDFGIRNPYRKGIHKQKKSDPTIHYWTLEKRRLFLDTADKMGTDFFFPVQLLKDMTEFHWLVGGRVQSLLTLKVGKIDLNEGSGRIHFQGHKVKGARFIAHPFRFKRAIELASTYIGSKTADDFLFSWDGCHKRKNQGNGVEYWSFNRAFKAVCQAAGIVDGANIHSLKKTYGMERSINGAGPREVQSELQHKNFQTTETHYLDMDTINEETAKRSSLPQDQQERIRQGYTPNK